MDIDSIVFVFCHVVAGLAAGYVVAKLYRKKMTGIKAYFIYVASMAVFFVAVGTIGQMSLHSDISELSQFTSLAAAIISFLLLWKFDRK